MTDEPAKHSEASVASALGWGVFLGMSWTWCIGMFLPVLLVRDFGAWGWVVFAVPNVLGAAAMGWVIRSQQHSRALIDKHRVAMAIFSLVTICFHAFFVSWKLPQLAPDRLWTTLTFVAAAGFFYLIGRRGNKDVFASIVLLALSSLVMVWWMLNQKPDLAAVFAERAPSPRDLVALGSVCVLGFLCCPYLDLTFHRARLATEGENARLAFASGFGVFFFAMIVFTLMYASPMRLAIVGFAAAMLVMHITLQAAFTVAVHFRAIANVSRRWVLATILLATGSAALGLLDFQYAGLRAGEIIYRCFLSFYGLAAPTYVWLVMLRPATREVSRRDWLLIAITVCLAIPFFWLAFIERRMPMVLIGVGIVLLARLIVSRTGERPEETSSGESRKETNAGKQSGVPTINDRPL